ncbi:MAG: hypothetical protein ABIF84_00220 [Patescibacteria group bacterium]
MDIRQNRPAAAADTETTTQTQKSQSDSSLLYRMAVRTMLEDLETVKKKQEMIAPPVKSTIAPRPTIIPVPLPPAYLASPVKTSPQPTTPPAPPVKTERAKIVVPIPPAVKPKKETKDELTKTIEAIVAEKTPKKTTGETTIKKETETKEEKQKAKEEQRIAQQTTREEEKKRREEEEIAKELAEKTAKELGSVEETEKREAVKKLREESNQNLEKAQIDYEAGAYENVIELAQKILANESASWFLKLKVNQLIKKANRGLRKKQINQIKEATQVKDEENLKKIVASLPSSIPPIATQKITASPPPNLPTLPDSSKNIKDLAAQALPQENPKETLSSSSKTISPLLTELISDVPSESEAEESGPSFLKNKRLLFIGASFVLVIILVSFGVWFANRDTDSPIVASPSKTPITSITPTPSRPAPEPLFAVDKQKIIKLENEGPSLKESLLVLAKTEEPIGIFTALAIKDNTNKFLSLKEIAQNLNLEIFSMPTQGCDQITENCTEPKTIEELLDITNFSLFSYSQNGSSADSSSPFTAASSTNEGRLGLIINLKKQTGSISAQSIEGQLINSLKDLETLLPKEFASLLLKKDFVIPQIQAFSPVSYKNTNIRYLNLPMSDISIDYAIADGKLIFATSKESMLAVIDRLITTIETGENF